MKVLGWEPSWVMVDTMLNAFRSPGPWSAAQMEQMAVSLGVPEGNVAHRFVDRLIQKERKAHRIHRKSGLPQWYAGDKPSTAPTGGKSS